MDKIFDMNRKILFAGAIFLLPILATAQSTTYKVMGKVSTESGVPLKDATITLKGSGVSAITDSNGYFEVSSALENPEIEVQKGGFAEQNLQVHFSGNENRTTYVEVTLDPTAKEIPEVTLDNPSLVTRSKARIQRDIDNIPGGALLVDLSSWKLRKSQTLKDAIGNQPGVIIQQFFGGNDQPRLNIRGSGIQSNPQSRGVALLQDGIPVNLTDGSYIIGAVEPQASHLVEIFKGANAAQFGSSTLGGAINFITKNGYNSAPLSIKVDAGSYGTVNAVLSSGFVSGKEDGYVSLAYNSSDGFRAHNSSRLYNGLLNLGHKFSDKVETRLLLNYTDLAFDIPGPLTKEQYLQDPKQINGKLTPKNIGPNVQLDSPGREARIFRIASASSFKIGERNTINATLYSQYTDDTFTFPISEGVRNLLASDRGFTVAYHNQSASNHFTAGTNLQVGNTEARYFINKGGTRANLFAKEKLDADKQMIYVNDVLSVSPKFKVNGTLQVSWDSRKVVSQPDDPAKRPSFSYATGNTTYAPSSRIDKIQKYTGFNPKIGIIYMPFRGWQIFGNASRSYEPPTFLEILNVKGGSPNSSPTSITAADLQAQTAWTTEIGTRGGTKNGRFIWDISLYNSEIKHELLAITDINGITGQTINSPARTLHRGIEAGLKTVPIQNIFKSSDAIKIGVSYTYSDFYFKEGAYKGNKIAGIPRNYVIAETEYMHPSGLVLNFNIESIPQKTPIDHHNELYQDPYTLLNARISFNKGRWGIYAEGRNLGNKVYASSYLVRDATTIPAPMLKLGATKESATNYIPGVGRNFTIGFNFTL